jgi:chemotaxis protein CheC
MKKEYSDFDLDILKEISNIGLGNSSRVFSDMIKKEIKVKIANFSLITEKELVKHMGGSQQVYAIAVNIKKEIAGSALNILNKENSFVILETLRGKKGNGSEEIDEYDKDILKELSSMMIGAYLTALSKIIKVEIDISPPTFLIMDAKNILQNIIPKNHLKQILIFNIHNVLYCEEYELPIYCDLIINYEKKSIKKILEKAKDSI